MLDIDELKEEIDLEEVLVEIGAIFPGGAYGAVERPFLCPFHHNTDTPAASYNPLKQLFNCFNCGASGSVIDAAMLHLATNDMQEARRWLEELFIPR